MKRLTDELTKEKVLELLLNVKEDAIFSLYRFSDKGTFKCDFVQKNVVQEYVDEVDELSYRETSYGIDKSVVNISHNIGLCVSGLYKNQYYETHNTDGYMKYIDKLNKYNHIYIKIDKESTPKTISFKLGNKEKTLELIEEGFDGYVSKPYRQKYMKCVSAEDLEKHCNDEFFNPRMVDIGRRVLKIKTE